MKPETEKWNTRYRDKRVEDTEAVGVVRENLHLLPNEGRALELACGLGANAILLARHGLATEAWDISPVAVAKLEAYATQHRLPLQARVRDLTAEPPEPEGFDIIVVSRFLDRALCPAITAALRPGGVLFYQTFIREAITDRGPPDPRFRLARNELLTLFPALVVRFYREEGALGDTTRGHRDEAQLVAQHPQAHEAVVTDRTEDGP